MAEGPSYKGNALAGQRLGVAIAKALENPEDALVVAAVRQALTDYDEGLGIES